jgi:two-component system phosphate regulon sensor histidine kinase PhoR
LKQNRAPSEFSPPQSEAEEFVAAVAHDLRSPLCSLRAYLGLFEGDCASSLDETGRSYLSRIRTNIERMQLLVDELVALGGLNDLADGRQWIETREVFLQYAADLKPTLDERRISLILPQAPPMVYSVRAHFYRVLSNLVCNAVDHMGEVSDARIRLDLRETEGGVELVVGDNGQGIGSGLQSRIFERFFPCCSTEPRPHIGLGLAIVKRIMDAHAGSITVESTPGNGATFRAFFPSPG